MTNLHTAWTRAVVALTSAGLALAFTASAQAGSSSTITACVKKKTGAVTILSKKKAKKKCPKGSTKMTWSIAGKPGKNGKNGTNGANGSAGAPGSNGTNGTNGTNSPPFTVRDGAGN